VGVAYGGFYGLVSCRLCAGLTQGCFFPSVYGLLAAEFPSDAAAKTRILTALNGLGLLGIASSFLASPLLERAQLPRALVVEGFHGWRLAILAAGVPGFPWCFAWARSKLFKHSSVAQAEHGNSVEPVDFEIIISSRPFQAIVCGHFAHNWASIIVMAWLPMYLSEVLNLEGAYLSLACLPYLLMVITSPLAGIAAAAALKRGVDLWRVRCVMGVIGLIGPGIGLLIFPRIPTHLWVVALVCISMTMALTTCVSASVHASILDLCGPLNSGSVFSIANAISVLPGFFGVQAVGYLHESWGWGGTFGICSIIYLLAAYAYTQWGSAERIWD
jgi:MFS family permease